MVKKNIKNKSKKNNSKNQKKVVETRKKKQTKNIIKNKSIKTSDSKTKTTNLSTKKQQKQQQKTSSSVKKNIPKKSTKKNNNNNNNNDNKNTSSITEKVIIKSGAAVDKYVQNSSDYHVYFDKTTNKSYSATLNKSDLQKNNNKYYIIQLLEKDSSPNTFLFYCRWGRIGLVRGQINETFSSAQEGIKFFERKYHDKMKVGYTELHIDYGNEENNNNNKDNKKSTKKNEKNKKSPFSEQIIEFIKLIYNKNIVNQNLKEMGYDSSRMPLGKLAKETLNEGYKILKEIESELDKTNPNNNNLLNLSSKFFTMIPHDFGFKKMSNFIINNKDILKNKIEMIDSLINMKVVTKIIDDENKNQNDENDLISIYYNKLHCEIKHISPNEKIYSILSEYLKNTSKYYSNIKILELYSVNREGEDKKYLNLKNKYLLWHGTRISNFVGILSQGLRIAPPEAPSSGYLYGKGLYFADMFAKSYNYCSPQNGIALILLVEVCLGNIEKRYNTDWKLPNTMKKNSNSINGVGAVQPTDGVYIDKDIFIPKDKIVEDYTNYSGTFNEFIVYNTDQVKLKYIFKVKVGY